MTLTLTVAASAFPLAPAASPEAWAEDVRARVRVTADGGAALIVLPEYLTSPLLALDRDWSRWTPLWRATIIASAREHRIAVLGGTHIVREGEISFNRALLVQPDGSEITQDKLHPTPWERHWGLPETDALRIVEVAGARLAILVCYDIEFPELARASARAGAEVLAVPSWTDDRAGFQRVRWCAHARCIENTVYVVHAPLVGAMPSVPDFEQACGSAGVLTPSDAGFARDGLAAEGGWDQPVTVLAELDLELLRRTREQGTVRPLADARAPGAYRIR